MHLDKIEIHGFKSFKDKIVLEFPDKFTAIVGPNGAGKSNVVESICFVLGRNRGIRSNNMQDLICNGGLHGEPSDIAAVSMYLSDGNNKKIKISREVDREGKSIYRKDNKRTTKQEIIEVIGDNEYNIILQDDITKLIDMNPKDRRKIIDDLCGIGEYDKKKEKAIRELEKVEKRISDTQLILGEKQGYLNQLEKERDDALRYKKLQSDLEQHRGSILYTFIKRHKEKLERIGNDIQNLMKEKDGKDGSIAKIREDISKRNNELKEINSEILKLEGEKGKGGMYELKGELLRMQDKIEALNQDLSRIENEISEDNEKVKEFDKEKKEIDSKVKVIDKDIAGLSKKIEKESKKVVDVKADSKLDKFKTRIFELQSKKETILRITEHNLDEISSLEKEMRDLEANVGKLLEQEKILARRIDEKLIQNKENFDEFERLRKELPSVTEREKKIVRDIGSLRVELAEKKTEVKTLEKSSGGVMRGIGAVMKLKEVIPGIYGTVFQLGSVTNLGYETALRIAAGNRMMNIVVENEGAASKCINYLREKRIGRATFLPLNKVKVIIKSKPPKGSIGFARDFIDTKKKFRSIFEYVFRDTILIKNLEAARSIGIGKWRMVTLGGDLIELSGAMTGGYIRKIPMTFSNTEDLENEIKNLERRILELEGERQELELKRERIEDRISKLEAPVGSGRTDVEKVKLEKDSLKGKRTEFKEDIDRINEKLKNLRKEISKGDADIRKIERDIETYEAELKKIEKKTPRAGLGELEELRDKQRDLEIEKNKLLGRDQLITKQIKDIKDEAAELEKQRISTEEELKQKREDVVKLGKELDSKVKENKEIVERVEKLMNRRADLEDEIIRLGEGIGETEYQINSINENLNKIQINKAKLETKLSDMQEEFKSYAQVEILEKSIREVERQAAEIEAQLEGFEAVNMRAIEAYDKVKEEFEDVTEKLETLKDERQSIFNFMEKVETRKREVFMETFNVINENFERTYNELSGGEGTLTLNNPRKISESGLLITASPKGKRLISIDSMSGGEKVVTCSAFLLAIQQYRPAYFYVVDELDAPLDKENSLRFAEMLKKSAAQFMLITHNDYVIKHADSVIGVSMTDGLSQIVGVKLT